VEENRSYREKEAEEILLLAARQPVAPADEDAELLISAAALERSAREIGISPEALWVAKAEHAKSQLNDGLRKEFLRENRDHCWFSLPFWIGLAAGCAFLAYSEDAAFFSLPAILCLMAAVVQTITAVRIRFFRFDAPFVKWKKALADRPFNPLHDQLIRKFCEEIWNPKSGPIPRLEAIRFFRYNSGLELEKCAEAVDSFASRNPQYFYP